MKDRRPIVVAVLIPLVSVFIAGGLIYSVKSKSSKNGDRTSLPIEAYIEYPKSFSGNKYALTASVDSQLAYSEGRGRIILLKTFSNNSMPLFVPAEVKGFNPNVGQRYDFRVRIDGDGKLVMTNFRKL